MIMNDEAREGRKITARERRRSFAVNKKIATAAAGTV
jgi:hypothetical protein